MCAKVRFNAVFFWIETLSYPKSKMYGRKSGCTMENLILGSVIKILKNGVWKIMYGGDFRTALSLAHLAAIGPFRNSLIK
jgi:hypothetical protein